MLSIIELENNLNNFIKCLRALKFKDYLLLKTCLLVVAFPSRSSIKTIKNCF